MNNTNDKAIASSSSIVRRLFVIGRRKDEQTTNDLHTWKGINNE